MKTEYKNYTIQEDRGEFMYYPTEQGVQHDGEWTGDSWRYCGNCKWTSSEEYAKLEIDELE